MDCCVTLGTIEKMCGGGNPAGLKTKLYVACLDDIATIPARDDYATDDSLQPHTITADIVMEATKVFFEFNFSKTGHSYTITPEGEAEFVSNNAEIVITIPKLSPLSTYILNGMQGGEFVVLATDKNGQRRIIGDLEEGMSVTVQEATNDQNAYTVTFSLSMSELPLFYTGVIPV